MFPDETLVHEFYECPIMPALPKDYREIAIYETIMMHVSVRRYQEHDYSRVCALNSMRIPGGYHGAVFVRQASVLFPATFLVADRNGEVIGFIIGAREQENSGNAWILRLGVDVASRRQQVGRRLLTELVEIFRSMEIHRLFLSVSTENGPAIRLYEDIGFEQKEFCNAYFGEGEPRIMMHRDI
jgi:ribosomal-protein-alanine N-acetyltransferase